MAGSAVGVEHLFTGTNICSEGRGGSNEGGGAGGGSTLGNLAVAKKRDWRGGEGGRGETSEETGMSESWLVVLAQLVHQDRAARMVIRIGSIPAAPLGNAPQECARA